MSSRKVNETEARDGRTAHSRLGRSGSTRGFVIKLVLMAAVNAFGLYGILASWAVANWGILAFLVIALILANLVYFLPGKRLVPFKYLAPGLTFLIVFQVFVILFTAGTAFTNYGDGHNSSKEAAVRAIVANSETRVDGSSDYRIAVFQADDGSLALAAQQQGSPLKFIGTERSGLQVLADMTGDPGSWQIPGYTALSSSEVLAVQEDVAQLRVPVPGSGASLRTNDGYWAYEYMPGLTYKSSQDAMTAENGTEYRPDDGGNFVSADGQRLTPGWQVNVGFSNFAAIFDPKILGGPFLAVTLWTFAFAILSVLLTFFAGLFLALLFNKPSMKGRGIYRALLFLPYAFPVFLSVLVWAGLLNRDFGFINEVLFGGAQIPWLTDPVLAKVSVLLVNLWLGFPYMFLICMGALQSIPSDLYESARLDGAGPWNSFRRITLPLLLVAVGPLLIASFAMNFNNFNVIYLLTNGGPRDLDSATGVGATDILITFVYKIAFESGASQYGLASAISILIFIMVAVVSLLTFRRSKALEDISS
ncbi:ABC transporter permease subunit [Acaricomes phytoseiuli]|uniref:ABC transporter permease subunit n=1 Tax=Acaricomes phytoseiuli TaxID=291968 RepID=UPI000378F0B5|nr:ABC transporter permease subunit [Acaricomes phytoseiuli]